MGTCTSVQRISYTKVLVRTSSSSELKNNKDMDYTLFLLTGHVSPTIQKILDNPTLFEDFCRTSVHTPYNFSNDQIRMITNVIQRQGCDAEICKFAYNTFVSKEEGFFNKQIFYKNVHHWISMDDYTFWDKVKLSIDEDNRNRIERYSVPLKRHKRQRSRLSYIDDWQ
jgi:hypothetical protein